MFDQFLLIVNEWMAGGVGLAGLGAFLWGMVSVLFSPCHVASIPLFVAYVAGQEAAVNPGKASWYAGAFTVGLFITITVVGIGCALLGRILGDVGVWWHVLVGAGLIWVALGMMGIEACSMTGTLLYQMKLKGIAGAFVLGLSYGVLSGSCTFGFIAPILAIVTVQQQPISGSVMMVFFAFGHCLPIMVAGSSAALVRKIMENRVWMGTGAYFRKSAGVIIALLGIYFVVNPFIPGT